VVDLIARVINEHHGDLAKAGVTVHVLMATNENKAGEPIAALKQRGYPIAAQIQITSLADRNRGIADAKLTIDEFAWDRLPDASRIALLDHELEHLSLVYDSKTGQLKHDDLGRPKLRTRPHDFEVGFFNTAAQRHGAAAVEVQALRAFRCEQVELFGETKAT
jgi:hypothetical protein